MCIIAIKEVGIEFPTIETLKTCFENNPDGAGFMYPRAHKVHIEKGFLTWDTFKERYEKILKTFTKATPFIFHFRIGTHGGKTAGMTHPFPIGGTKPDYTALNLSCDLAFAHNGIFSFLPTHAKYSDSVIYARDILTPLSEKFPDSFIDNGAEKIIMATLGWSKLAFMRGDGSIEYFGHWEKEKGIHYSNSTFEPYIPIKTYTYDYTKMGTNHNVTYDNEDALSLFEKDIIPEIADTSDPIEFAGSDKENYNKLIFIREGDEWNTTHGLSFSGFDFRDDPFPTVARISDCIYQYDDYTDYWDFVGYMLKPKEE